jgi:hypothetical protein
MAKIRVNRAGSAMDAAAIDSVQNNSYAGAKKSLHVGPDFKKQTGNSYVSGQDASGGIAVNPWSQMYLYNNSSTIAWVSLASASGAPAPTGIANAIPLQPNSWTLLCAGENSYIQTSASTVGVYTVNDDTTVRDIDPNT